tara:strand:+ start:63152 stop:63991 length:840 start_codon:yes stop_codon:yes gene_type:complete
MNAYLRLIRFDKPIGTYLVLWPTLWGLIIASQGRPKLSVLIVFVLGVVLMRAAGCIINDIADRNIDGKVARTKLRPLATGEISTRAAIIYFIVLCLLAFGLVLTMNRYTILLSFVAVFIAALYPFTKRVFNAPQFILGLAFAWAVPMAFAAQTNHVPAIAWWLYLAVVSWVMAYDTMYAMVDREDDKHLPIKSTALWFAKYDKLMVGLLQLATLVILFFIGRELHVTTAYNKCLIVTAGLFAYQQYLIRHREPKACFNAFLNNNYVGLVMTIGLLLNFF